MDTWDIASLDVQPHQPEVLRSDDETRVLAINLPAGEALQDHQVHERAWIVVVDGRVEAFKVQLGVSCPAMRVWHGWKWSAHGPFGGDGKPPCRREVQCLRVAPNLADHGA